MNLRPAAALLLACALPLPAPAPNAWSQAFPARPIRLVVPYPAGGTADVVARVLQPPLGTALGQPLVVENRAGGNTLIGADLVAKAPPDGHTLLLTTAATHTLVQFTSKTIPYDPIRDFTPISSAGRSRGYVVVNAALPVSSFRELIEYARRHPDKLSYGTPNIASSFHLSGVLLEEAAGVKWVHVPYKGGAAAMRAVASGEIPMSIGSNGSGLPVLQSGKAKLLAVLDADRDPRFPEVPTVAEHYPGFERTADWTGIYGPGGTPRPVVARLNRDIVAALKAPETVQRLASAGLVASPSSPEAFAAMIVKAIEVHRRAVQAAGIEPQ